MSTGYNKFDPMDDFPHDPLGGVELGQDCIEAPTSTSAQVDQQNTVIDTIKEHQQDIEEGKIWKESAGESTDHEAGASTFSSSPLFCSSSDRLVWVGSSGSLVILRRYDKPGKSLGKTGYTYMDVDAIHYVYKWGAKKGIQVSLEDASKVMRNPTYSKGLLVPV
ncbi:unnamed protein product [Calypogeia fissa]